MYDLFLNFAVKRNRNFLSKIILSEVDERILLGKLVEGVAERTFFGRLPWDNNRL